MHDNRQKSIGPFKALGIAFSTVATAAVVVDSTVRTGGEVITSTLMGINLITTKGVEALEIALQGPIDDMRCDAIVDTAYRQVRLAQAQAEAARIMAELNLPVVPRIS